jgi:hypothetical protein
LEENGWHPFYNSGNFKYQLRINVWTQEQQNH